MAERVAKCSPKLPNAGERSPKERSVAEGRWHAATLSDCREGASMFQHKHPLEGRITGGHAGMSGMGTHILQVNVGKSYFSIIIFIFFACPRHARDMPANSPSYPPISKTCPQPFFAGMSRACRPLLDIVVWKPKMRLVPLYLVVSRKHARHARMPTSKWRFIHGEIIETKRC